MKRIAVCIDNSYYRVSLTLGKSYDIISEQHGMIEIIDETDEAYLFPKELFRIEDIDE